MFFTYYSYYSTIIYKYSSYEKHSQYCLTLRTSYVDQNCYSGDHANLCNFYAMFTRCNVHCTTLNNNSHKSSTSNAVRCDMQTLRKRLKPILQISILTSELCARASGCSLNIVEQPSGWRTHATRTRGERPRIGRVVRPVVAWMFPVALIVRTVALPAESHADVVFRGIEVVQQSRARRFHRLVSLQRTY